MGGLLRKLVIYICCPLYKMIPTFYKIFYNLANYRLFKETNVIEQLSANLYVLVSVIMLFAFSTTIISAIVNPDLLSDNKKGVAAIFKRSMLGIILMILVPFLFDSAYEVQKSVMDNSLIEKILVGISYENAEENPGGNGGQVIAGTLIASVLYPAGDDIGVTSSVSSDYKTMVQSKIGYIDRIAENINITISSGGADEKLKWEFSSEDYAFQFNGIVALVAGGATCYILLLFAMDMAVRLFKLAFLELTAPISIVAYMATGDSVIKKWAGEVGKTFADVFIRIAAIAFYLFMLNNLPSIMNSFVNEDFSLMLRALIIVGLLVFVKQLPGFIGKVFGINIESKGGIGGRLGQMAMVGEVAKKAWDATKKTLANVAPNIAALPLVAAGAGIGYGINRATNGKFYNGLKTVGRGLKTAGNVAGSTVKGFASGNPINAYSKATKAYKETDFGKEKAAEKERKKAAELYEEAGLNSIGKLKNGKDATVAEAVAGTKKLLDKISADGSLTSKQKETLKGKVTADQINALAKKAMDSNDKVLSQFDTMISNSSNNPAVQGKLKELKDGFMNGNMTLSNVTASVKTMAESGKIGTAEANNIIGNINKLHSVSETMKSNDIQNFLKEKDIKIDSYIDSEGKLKSSAVKNFNSSAEKISSDAKGQYDSYVSTASEKTKETMARYDSVQTDIANEYARTAADSIKICEMAKPNDNNSNTGSSPNQSGNSSSTQNQNPNQSGQSQNTSNNSTSSQNQSTQSQDMTDEDIMDMMSEVQAEVNEERLNDAWRNQTTDDTYRRGTFEPERNTNDDSEVDYDDIFGQQYDDSNE